MQDPAKDWNLTLAEKKELLGDTLREQGGKSAMQVDTEVVPQKRAATDLEPVSWHSNSVDCWKEMLHGYLASSVLDLTPQNDNLAVAAIQLNVKYIAICNTPAHVEMLQKRLQDRIFELQRDPTCENLYNAVAVSELDFLAQGDEAVPATKGKGGKGKGKRGSKSKGKAKTDDGQPSEGGGQGAAGAGAKGGRAGKSAGGAGASGAGATGGKGTTGGKDATGGTDGKGGKGRKGGKTASSSADLAALLKQITSGQDAGEECEED